MGESLVVVWTSGDREAAEHMVFMYTRNAALQGWFENVILVIWGPSARLITEDAELQSLLREILSSGVRIEACLRCAERYGVVKDLEELGVEVKLMGSVLSGYLKEGRRVLTF
jgi:hypothetical protein